MLALKIIKCSNICICGMLVTTTLIEALGLYMHTTSASISPRCWPCETGGINPLGKSPEVKMSSIQQAQWGLYCFQSFLKCPLHSCTDFFEHLRMRSEFLSTGMKLEFSSSNPWPSSSETLRPLIITRASFPISVWGGGASASHPDSRCVQPTTQKVKCSTGTLSSFHSPLLRLAKRSFDVASWSESSLERRQMAPIEDLSGCKLANRVSSASAKRRRIIIWKVFPAHN